MDIGKLFRDAWGLFVKDIGPLIVGMLIASIVPAVAAVIIAAATIGASISGLQVDEHGAVTGVDSMNWALLISGTVAIVVVTLLLSVPLYVGILSVIPVVGVILGLVAAPFGVAYVVSMYFQASGQGALVDAAVAQAPASPGAGG